MPTLRSGKTYGEGITQSLSVELDRCYQVDDRFNKTSKNYGLIFLDVIDPVRIIDYLKNINHKIKPSDVEYRLIDNNNGFHSLLVIISYHKRVNVTRSAYFKFRDIVPLVSRERNLKFWIDRMETSINKSQVNERLPSKTINDRNMTEMVNVPKVEVDSRHLVLYGGVGKTSIAKSILNHRCLVVERVDDLLSYDPKVHSGIIFENFNFKSLDLDNTLYLLTQEDRTLCLENGDVNLSADAKLIFTTRIKSGKIFNLKTKELKRLVKVVRCPEYKAIFKKENPIKVYLGEVC